MDRSQVRFDSGLVVESDLLTAKVRIASRQQELIRARNTLDLARAQLNTAMGVPLESLFQPAEALAERVAASPPSSGNGKRGTHESAGLEAHSIRGVCPAAERCDCEVIVWSASERLRRLGDGQSNILAGGGGNNWLGGMEVQFDHFQGGAKRAELSRQRALADRAGSDEASSY